MGMRVELILLFMLGASWACHSRDLGIINPFVGKTLSGKKKIHPCSLCQKPCIVSWCRCPCIVAEALLKLKDPDTELELVEMLLKVCNSVKGSEKQCKKMVFEYGPIILVNAEHLLESNDICTMLHACESPKSNTKQASTEETIMIASS